jgi:RND family efflux transporter MFP subunit
LALLFSCDRVSVGLSGRRHVKVEALSHTTEFRANQSLLRDIGAAMEEAVWQGATLNFPLPEGAQPRVDRAHADLAQRHGSAWISTVPLVKSGRPCGAITLERNRAEALSRADLTLCENIGALLGPLLDVKRTVDKPWPGKIAAALQEATAPLFGPGHLGLKAGVTLALAALAAAAFITGDYRVSAPARLEGAVQRVMVAPAEGYLKQVFARPGDRVKKGQVVAELADEDLKLEERKAQSELSQLENSYGTALVKQDRAEVAIQGAKLEQARAQLSLVQSRLQRTQVTAPFDSVVITGDLTQSLGAPVKKGEALMTLAPEHDFRVILEVDERDVADVQLGKAGSLALSALPGDTFPLEVNRITPVAATGQGRNYFEVEAKLKTQAEQLRPGLLGVGKVEAGSRSLLWIWTHRVSDWLRLTVWSWFG